MLEREGLELDDKSLLSRGAPGCFKAFQGFKFRMQAMIVNICREAMQSLSTLEDLE